MTDTMAFKDVCVAKYQEQDAFELINRKLLIHKQLEKPPRNYVVYSDLHGSYEKFLHWLKNGLGFYKIVVNNGLGESYGPAITEAYERLLYMINRARFDHIETFIENPKSGEYDEKAHFFEPVPKDFCRILQELEDFGLTRKRVLLDCIGLLREVTRGDERRIIKLVPQKYLENILKLYHQSDEESFAGLLKGIVENKVIFQFISSLIIRLVVFNVFDKHINLGDTFDRGESADKLLKIYRTFFSNHQSTTPMQYIWGNHDILWMGAVAGNPILCVDALRISMRYNNVAFLKRYGFDLSKVYALADATYRLAPSGSYVKGKDFQAEEAELAAKVAKCLLVIQMKLTLGMLRAATAEAGDVDYRAEHERHEKLLAMLPVGIAEDAETWAAYCESNPLFSDVYFPTISADNPALLTADERAVVDDIVRQFTTLPTLRADIQWLFDHGELYRVVDHTLYFHAAVPSTEDQSLMAINGRSGKELFDYFRGEIKRAGAQLAAGQPISLQGSMLFWFLWCGADSPLFCKSKMATLERAVFHKEPANADPLTTHTEKSNSFYKHIRSNLFLSKLLEEFHADKICMGHTPIKTMKQAILSDSIRAFIVDGGASAAYGDRGAVLIYTPEYSYLTFHPCLKDLIAAEDENRLPAIQVRQLEERGRLKLRHMEKGYFLEKELQAINEVLANKLGSFGETYFC